MRVAPLIALLAFSTASAADSPFVLPTTRAQSPPDIDGAIVEQVWQTAARADSFMQYEPVLGSLSDFRTEAMVLYDSMHIYVAFRLWDPDAPTAQLLRRDADLFQDDAVILILDTHHDRRSAYYFMTNALATQVDGRVADDGRTVDKTWDAPWQCAALRTDSGWTVEMSIPLTSLKYRAGDSVQWGVNFGRSRRRNLETSFWAGPLENRFRVSQAGILDGLNIAQPSRRYQIIPYALSRFQEKRTTRVDAGIDIRYAITPTLAAYVTVNPDFATIEADQEQINLTRFELFLPEKRQFFLEGNELYKQRIRTFYSRRIPDILAGAKVLGKAGPLTLAALATQADPVGAPVGATYAVVRAQSDVLGSSNISFMVANRTLRGTHQGSAGIDATLFFTRTFGMTGQVVKSYGLSHHGTWAYFIRPSYDSPTLHYHIRYTHLGQHLAENVNVIGFIPDDNRRELDGALEKTFWVQSGMWERFQYDSNYNIYWGQNGILRSWQIDQEVEIELRSRIVFQSSFTEEFKRFEKDFQNRRVGFELGYNTREFESAQVGFTFGRNFDSDFYLWSAEAAYKLTPQLSVEYELQRLTLRPDLEMESTWIHILRVDQFFTNDLYLRVFFQTNSAISRQNVQAVFVYRYQPPFGTIQVAYQRGTAEFGQESAQGNTFFLKVTHVF
ncbi:MAG: carbohydrate binding family 9 domain-containing protein [Bacteroidetes bacterium]|nr:carbohydrate binding family 9 domain-containing protein [Bacteroidota bacterium]